MKRWIGFLLMIAVGAALALYYGWVLNPVQYIDTTPDSLRKDFKTDYVLMVSEAYRVEGSLNQAARRLAVLGEIPPTDIVSQAIQEAGQLHYNPEDIKLMQDLADALATWNPSQEAPTP